MNEDQVNDKIQRWRDTPEEDLKPEDYQELKNLGSACLSEGKSTLLLKFIQDKKNQGIVKSMGCVLLVPLVTELVKKEKSLDCCQTAITNLTRTCRPEELLQNLLALINNTDPGVISETITALFPHLQTVLLQLDEKRAASVGLALSAVQKQLSRLPVPYNQQQENDDEYGLCRSCTALAEFAKCFVEKVKRKDVNYVTTPEEEELRVELLKFCMRSLREPLLDAELNKDRQSVLWHFATKLMVILHAIQESLSEILLFNSLRKRTQMDNTESKESRACLAYILFVQLITIDSFPAVFSPVFVLQCNMEYISQLLSSLESVPDNSLPVSLLGLKSFHSVPQNLQQVLTDCPIQHLRESGLQVFQNFINKLDAEAKHKFFRHETMSCFCSSRIIESLNLLRYLVIRDKKLRSNVNMWEELCRIKDEYLKMLRVCIGISRTYYSAELQALREDQKLKAKGRCDQQVDCFYVPQVLQCALVTFDLMESLIVRIEEITEEKFKIPN
uniref:Glomulin, FKBP associated protein b n=1 Tax=Mastacembelus armatus TaxID=205130 RepID=A0A3Q3LPV6_9TELE